MNFTEAFGHVALLQSRLISDYMSTLGEIKHLTTTHYEIVTQLGTSQQQESAIAAMASAQLALDEAGEFAGKLGVLARDLARVNKGSG